MSISDQLNHLESIRYHSEPSDDPYSPNQLLGWDFLSFLTARRLQVGIIVQQETLSSTREMHFEIATHTVNSFDNLHFTSILSQSHQISVQYLVQHTVVISSRSTDNIVCTHLKQNEFRFYIYQAILKRVFTLSERILNKVTFYVSSS